MQKIQTFIEENKEDIAASLEFTIVDILMKKLKAAVKETGIKHVAVAGGVSANKWITQRIQRTCREIWLDHLYT